jgi:hypothetical protein
VLDGVYRCDADGVPAYVESQAPTDDELHALLHTFITRLMKMLTRRGVLVEDMGWPRWCRGRDGPADQMAAARERLRMAGSSRPYVDGWLTATAALPTPTAWP